MWVFFPPAMWFGICSRRVLCYSMFVFLMMPVLQMWVCCHSCQAGAIRVFPPHTDATAATTAKANISSDMDTKEMEKEKEKEDLFDKYFKGMRTAFGPINKTDKGFEDSKRRVPSCPDPLHN